MDNHYNHVIFAKLSAIADKRDWPMMIAYLNGLSNSAFRTASYVLCERVLPLISEEDYWDCFTNVALTNTKAYLVTFLKAAIVKYVKGNLSFFDNRFTNFAQSTAKDNVSLDRKKSLLCLLPILRTSGEVSNLLDAFCDQDIERKVNYLLQSDESIPGYYVLFLMMRQLDHQPQSLLQICQTVLRRSNDVAFNFVSLCVTYFDIVGLKAKFSLQINPYELSRMETSYDEFVCVLERMH